MDLMASGLVSVVFGLLLAYIRKQPALDCTVDPLRVEMEDVEHWTTQSAAVHQPSSRPCPSSL